MKNFSKLFGIIALIAVIGFSFASCKDSGSDGSSGGGAGGTIGSGAGGTDPALNGRWKAAPGLKINEITFNNGNFLYIEDDYDYLKGTYTTKDGKITFTGTHYKWNDPPTDKWEVYNSVEIVPYSISGNKLTVTGPYTDGAGNPLSATLTKQ